MGRGGGACHMLAREMEELLAEHVRVRTGEFTPEATGEGVEPYEAKLPTEPRGWETRAGAALANVLTAEVVVTVAAAWSPRRARAFRVAVAFWDEAGGRLGGRKEEDAETFSKDSSGLSLSSVSVPVPVQSCSMGNACSLSRRRR